MMSSRYDLYGLGYSRATTVRTKRSKNVSFSNTQKTYLSSDCTLKIGYMKLESLVIVYQNGTVNTPSALVHTARHALEISFG
jgi:hypothetical protein